MSEDFALSILEHNRAQLCRSARECVESGIPDPIVVIADVRDAIGQAFAVGLGKMSAKQLKKMIREFAKAPTVPTIIVGMPLSNFHPLYKLIHGKPLTIGATPTGKFYACVIADGRTKITVLPLLPNLKPSLN